MAEFAKYAFNKSHAAAYAVVSYRTAYIKAYCPEALLAATLNSYLGNLDRIPMYIDECRNLNIKILKPDINKSHTKFAIEDGAIRFGLGSIKNVGIQAVDDIVAEREKNGPYKSFTDFCERIQECAVNKKCVESLIKAGAFDEFEQTRKTLIQSFEEIIDTIQDGLKRLYSGQVSMFDIGESKEEIEKHKYIFNISEEYTDKEMLSMEKEMLGIYISGHPLEKIKKEIFSQANIDTVKMAFVTIEDLYGQAEVIVFENCYMQAQDKLMEENIVLVTGKLSIRDEEPPSIIAMSIDNLTEKKDRKLELDIRGIAEEKKEKLRGAIRFKDILRRRKSKNIKEELLRVLLLIFKHRLSNHSCYQNRYHSSRILKRIILLSSSNHRRIRRSYYHNIYSLA